MGVVGIVVGVGVAVGVIVGVVVGVLVGVAVGVGVVVGDPAELPISGAKAFHGDPPRELEIFPAKSMARTEG